MKTKNQWGFAHVVLAVFVVFVVVIGGSYYLWRSMQGRAGFASNPTQPVQQNYLTIKEWGVKVQLGETVEDATYRLISNTLGFRAYLSTSALNATAACQEYYAQNASMPSFQYIQRYELTNTLLLNGSGPLMTAEQAASQAPAQYKRIGNHVYSFGTNDGSSCPDQDPTILPGFQSAFLTITAAN